MSRGASGASITKTLRLLGSTGSVGPASAATRPADGPAALTSVPQPMRAAVGEADGGDAARFDVDRRHLAGDERRAGIARGGAQRLEQRMGIEPAFAGEAERAAAKSPRSKSTARAL